MIGNIKYKSESGYLLIDLRSLTGDTLVIGDWERNLEVFTYSDRLIPQNDYIDPGLPFVKSISAMQEKNAIQEYINTIPDNIFKVVSPFLWRQFILLKIFKAFPLSAEFVNSNPILLWLTAEKMVNDRIPIKFAESILSRKRHEILRWVTGNIDEKWIVNLLSKIRFFQYRHEGLLSIKNLLNDYDLMYSIRNTSIIHGENLPVIFRYSSLYKSIINNRLAPELLNQADSFLELIRLWSDLEYQAERLGRIDVLMSKKSFQSLRCLHEKWTDELNKNTNVIRTKQLRKLYGTLSFPTPPIEGKQNIIPVMNYHELVHEGREMKHCVEGYAARIFEYKSYIYRVLEPQRATIEIVTDQYTKTPVLKQIRGIRNEPVNAETIEFVKSWLADHNRRHSCSSSN